MIIVHIVKSYGNNDDRNKDGDVIDVEDMRKN